METAETTVLVEYLGTKDRKEDNVSGSNVVWQGPGDIQPVTSAQWGSLSKHPEVWRKVAKATPNAKKDGQDGNELKADASKAKEAVQALSLGGAAADGESSMTVEQVHAAKFELPTTDQAPNANAKPAAKTAKRGNK
mgnify:CR=1 FL=1